MKALTGVLLILFMAGCGQGSTSGGLERGGGEAQAVISPEKPSVAPRATLDIGRSIALRHTPYPDRVIRWPSRHIPINVSEPWAVKGANVWRPLGFKFTHGMSGGITFGGYSRERNSVGWAKFRFSKGVIRQCVIYINPKWLRRYDISETFAHEIGHCLGINGHIPGGLMAWNGGNGVISPNTKAMLNYVYARRPGSRL